MVDREANSEVAWPDTASPLYSQFDSAASCSICNDFYDTPLVLLCGHSFCSNCIRSYVSHQEGQAKCPQCRAACDERDLRPNTALRDLVDKLIQVRPSLITAYRNTNRGQGRLIRKSDRQGSLESQDGPADTPPSNKRQLRSSKQNGNTAASSSQDGNAQSPKKRQRLTSPDEPVPAAPVQSVSAATAASNPPASTSGLAQCPICSRHFKAGRMLEAHVNRCIDNPPAPAPAPVQQQPAVQQQKAAKPSRKSQRSTPDLKVPAKIAFHLFNDKSLRAKLKDVKLPTTGKRKELEERYNRLRLECQLAVDKAEDVTEAELVRRVLSKEKRNALSKGFFGAAPNRNGLKAAGSGADVLPDSTELPEGDFESFAALIKATRERDAARKAKQLSATAAPAAADAKPGVSTSGIEWQPAATAPAAAPVAAAARAAPADSMSAAQSQQGGPAEGAARLKGESRPENTAAHPAGPATHLADADGLGLTGGPHMQPAQQTRPHRQAAAVAVQIADHPEQQRQQYQQALPMAEDRVDLTLDESADHISQHSLDVNVDTDDDISSAQPGVMHSRALRHLHLPNTQPAVLSKGGATVSAGLLLKTDLSSNWSDRHQTAEALDNLDAIVADSDPD